MKKKAVIAGVVGVVALVAVSAALAAGAPSGGSATVTTAGTALGRILADGQGRSLYLFEKDSRGRSACSGICATYWPPLLTNGTSVAIKGAQRSLLGSIRRADGSRQITYAGHPLYLFSGDTRRGQTNGEGLSDFGAGWYVLTPAGKIDRG